MSTEEEPTENPDQDQDERVLTEWERIESGSFHPDFQDASADLVISCENNNLPGPVKFRAHSYLLKAHSAYFRNMPEHRITTNDDSEKVIHLDIEPACFKLFLIFIAHDDRKKKFRWNDFAAVESVAVDLQCELIPDLIAGQIHRLHDDQEGFMTDSFEIFGFAARHGILMLAKTAIRSFGDEDMDNMRSRAFQIIPGLYVAELFHEMRYTPKWEYADGSTIYDWNRIALRFNPDHDPYEENPDNRISSSVLYGRW